ncbi:unnamed protein product [Protopolystoma xenopodis]|uniref:Uncharacterized protein n=1 Tax=Protopolystoma xenopodis TaxID=117903 RepID=A0A448XCL2_9PLAT|nr:unnamed protein product [Protopolystoma xenopodis]
MRCGLTPKENSDLMSDGLSVPSIKSRIAQATCLNSEMNGLRPLENGINGHQEMANVNVKALKEQHVNSLVS